MNKKIQRITGALLTVCVLSTAAPYAAAAGDGSHWAQDTMEAFSTAGYLTSGVSAPDAVMTRGEFAAMLGRVTGQSAQGADSAAITRQEAVVMVAEKLDLEHAELSTLNRFRDSDEIGADARQSVADMAAAGYINGTDSGKFLPGKQLTYAEAVTILDNALGSLRALSGETLYGTATLTYADYYSGDVSTTEHYGVDGVTTATVSKYSTLKNTYSNYTEDKTEGYNILGVKNVNVAVEAGDYEAYKKLNPTFEVSAVTPTQYKSVSIVNGKAVCSATHMDLADTVRDATAVLKTGSTWGDYEIDVYETSNKYIRNTRSDEDFAINSYVQGTILETESGLRVGLEFLQSMWVQPWEVSFNVTEDSAQNAHIVGWDNLPELAKLVGEKITRIIYLMPDSTYIYEFDGIYIKPAYSGVSSAAVSFTEGSAEAVITGVPAELEDVTVSIVYGTGRKKVTVADAAQIVNGKVVMDSAYDPSQIYTVKLSSSNYADVSVSVPVNASQLEQIKTLAAQARSLIDAGTAANDSGLVEHYGEAQELLANVSAFNSEEAAELIEELTGHLSVYVSAKA